jgi:hypothetical protein
MMLKIEYAYVQPIFISHYRKIVFPVIIHVPNVEDQIFSIVPYAIRKIIGKRKVRGISLIVIVLIPLNIMMIW